MSLAEYEKQALEKIISSQGDIATALKSDVAFHRRVVTAVLPGILANGGNDKSVNVYGLVKLAFMIADEVETQYEERRLGRERAVARATEEENTK